MLLFCFLDYWMLYYHWTWNHMFFWPWKNSVRNINVRNLSLAKSIDTLSISGMIIRYLDTIFYADLHLWLFALKRLMIQWVFMNRHVWGIANWELDINIPIRINSLPNYFQMPYFATNIITELNCLCLEFMFYADSIWYST